MDVIRILSKVGQLTVKSFFPNDMEMITITLTPEGFVLRSYQRDDEYKEDSVVATPDSRGRIVIPCDLLEISGIAGMVRISRIDENTVFIKQENRPMCNDCPYQNLIRR